MNILIIENEFYLAQSIAIKLTEHGHNCEQIISINEAKKEEYFDIVLLSTNIASKKLYPIIKYYKETIIILMVSYISNDTVSKPLKIGANDYILKPFMIEELLRKITHFQDFERLKQQNKTYKRYIKENFKSHPSKNEIDKEPLPLLIFSDFQKHADAYAFNYAKYNKRFLHFIVLSDAKAIEEIKKISKQELIYLTEFQLLKKTQREELLSFIMNRDVIISTTSYYETSNIRIIKLNSGAKMFNSEEIMPIADYVKYIVLNYQHKYPDTELSKKLGISRKSLWEKRKRYGIIKKNKSF